MRCKWVLKKPAAISSYYVSDNRIFEIYMGLQTLIVTYFSGSVGKIEKDFCTRILETPNNRFIRTPPSLHLISDLF